MTTPLRCNQVPSMASTQGSLLIVSVGGSSRQASTAETDLSKNTLNFLESVFRLTCFSSHKYSLFVFPRTNPRKARSSLKSVGISLWWVKEYPQFRHLYLLLPELWKPFFFDRPLHFGHLVVLILRVLLISF